MTKLADPSRPLSEDQKAIVELVKKYAPDGTSIPWARIRKENPGLIKHMRHDLNDTGFQKGYQLAYELRRRGLIPRTPNSRLSTKTLKAHPRTNMNGHAPIATTDQPVTPVKKMGRLPKKVKGWQRAMEVREEKRQAHEAAQEQLRNLSPEAQAIIEQRLRHEAMALMNSVKFCPRCGNDLTLLYHAQQLNAEKHSHTT